MSEVPVPDREDPLFAPFWDGTDRGELRVQRCPSCGLHRWPPRPMCRRCHALGAEWVSVEPVGTLYSWVGVRRQTVRGLPTPYDVGLVELDAQPVRMLGRLIGLASDGIRIGMALEARFDAGDSGVTLVNWVVASPVGGGADG